MSDHDPAEDEPREDDPAGDDENDEDARDDINDGVTATIRGERVRLSPPANSGRRRGNHGAGKRGQGVRGLRMGTYGPVPGPQGKGAHTVLAADLKPINATIRPSGRQLGRGAPGVGRPSFTDAPALVRRLLIGRRLDVLRAGLNTRGANLEEREARVYLAVILEALKLTAANEAAAELIFQRKPTEYDLRKLGDLRGRLRRGEYRPEQVTKAETELRERLNPDGKRRPGRGPKTT